MAETQASELEYPAIAVIGGGGGTAALYPGLAEWTPRITGVLPISDTGGSTGRLSEELELPLPVGDIRNVMMAASQNRAVKRLQRQRFAGNGPLKGHAVGNMLLAACLTEPGLDLDEALQLASDFFMTPGTILPVARTAAQLHMEDGPGNIIVGEHKIDVYRTRSSEPRIWLEPDVPINPRADAALRNADLIVIPGGSIYTSLLATLSVNGVARALKESGAPIVMLANLATESHQTDGWHVSDFVLALQRHGIFPDIVVYNNAMPTEEMLANYAAEGQQPVDFRPELFSRIPTVRAIGASLLSRKANVANPNDAVKRGLMRHDAEAVIRILKQILAEQEVAA